MLPITLQDRWELSAKVLKHICGTRPICVWTQQKISAKEDVSQLFHKYDRTLFVFSNVWVPQNFAS